MMTESNQNGRKLLKILLEKHKILVKGSTENISLLEIDGFGELESELEAIAAVHPKKRVELTQELKQVQAENDIPRFNRLVRRIEILAETARNI